GRQFLEKKEYDKALGQFENALLIFNKIGDHREATGTYFELGNLRFEKAEFNPALKAYQNALKQSENMDNPLLVSRILFMLGETYTALGQFPLASDYKSRYIALGDSIAAKNEAAMVYQMQLGEKDSKLVLGNLLQTKAKMKTLRSYLYSGIGITLLLLGLATALININRQKRNLAEQEALVIRQEAIEQIQIKELEANQRRLEGEEAIRTSIGRELHDGLGSMLSTVKLYYSSVEEKIGNLQEESKEQYQKANLLLGQACDQVRTISHEMLSAFLVKFGLKAQLESFAETIRDSGQLEVELATHGLKDRLDSRLEFSIYRIVQELVNNVIKHAGATRISIQVNRFESMVNIMVEDNGTGFDPEEAKNKGGIGLKNIRSRVHDLDGTTDFESAKGKGTSVSIDIPLQPGSPENSLSSTSSKKPINN
nr:ATP-binding protein [Flavilitoribacter sp.]